MAGSAIFDDLTAVGHAVTARIHCSAPPAVGHTYYDRTDWWNYILTVPAPRIVVVEDADERPGTGAFVGEVHANILRALGCVAYATNGLVRDLERARARVSAVRLARPARFDGYVHIVDFGEPVTVGGLVVRSGDVLNGDCHGLLSIPRRSSTSCQRPQHAWRWRNVKSWRCASPPIFSLEQLRVAASA